jgi:hypothetical protein
LDDRCRDFREYLRQAEWFCMDEKPTERLIKKPSLNWFGICLEESAFDRRFKDFLYFLRAR